MGSGPAVQEDGPCGRLSGAVHLHQVRLAGRGAGARSRPQRSSDVERALSCRSQTARAFLEGSEDAGRGSHQKKKRLLAGHGGNR